MAIKSYKPTTASRRHMTVTDYRGLSKVKPEKSLLQKLKKTAGRNSYGRITVRHHGGGNKIKYRIIDFKRDKMDMENCSIHFCCAAVGSASCSLRKCFTKPS